MTRQAICEFVRGVLGGGIIPSEAAEALLVLIPTNDNPKTTRCFRPISLCNVCLKLAMKMIVNHFKAKLKDIIGPNQTTFVPGRQGINNFVVCKEIIHTL